MMSIAYLLKQSKPVYRNVDVKKPDIVKIEHFLESGKRELSRAVVDSFLQEIGYDRLESLMLRLYITMELYVCARTFTQRFDVPNEAFTQRFGSIDEVPEKLIDEGSAAEYFSGMLEQCIAWRVESSKEDGNTVINKAKKYIYNNYNQDGISLKSVADAINLSPAYFSSLFKKDVGTNFVDYLTSVRIEKAKELLCCTAMKVSEIAYEVGFRDYRYFSQIFKKYTGKTPREFQHVNNN